MTRETKIGLVVSCSFLCLVGLVLGNKLREMSRNAPSADISANEAEQVAKAEKDAKDQDVGKVVPASAEEIKNLDPAPDPTEGKVLSVKATPAEKEKGDPDLPPNDDAEVSKSKDRVPVPSATKEKEVSIEIPSDNTKPLPKDKEGDLPPGDIDEKKNKNDKGVKEKESEVGNSKDKPASGKGENTELDGPPDVAAPDPAKIEAPDKKVNGQAKASDDLNSLPSDEKPVPDKKKEDKGPQSPVSVEVPVAIGQPKTNPSRPSAVGTNRLNQNTPEKELRPAVDVIVPPSQPKEKQPALKDREPTRQPIQVATAPYRRIPITSAPEVESFDEEIYRCRAGDSFARISQRFYQTDRYAQALEAFNRNHPQAGQAVRQQPGSLVVGQQIHIPPIAILRKRHASVISEEGTQPAHVADPREERTSSRPTPKGESDDNSSGSREYTVYNPNGETMREIAEKLLGNANRWQDIAKLNPGFQPLLPIPATASIKLPE
jgi:hypothetical protein